MKQLLCFKMAKITPAPLFNPFSIVEDMPEVIILPELWQKEISGVVPDSSHHVVQPGVRGWMFSSPPKTDKNNSICEKDGWQKGRNEK